MRFSLFFLLGIFFLSLQTTVLQSLPQWVGVPDLLFLMIVFLALYFKPWPGAVLTVLFGIVMEVFSGYFLGLYAMAYLMIFFVVKGLAAHFALDALNHQPPLVALAYLVVNAFVYLSSLMLVDGSLYPWGWGIMLQRALIVNILVIPI
ncbi:MAG: rod shape-determining protein MreD, partial [Desulfobulbaceae bacterium]|nr:rod shape-determining protein MreD [Desulfobulbaceae bacterium]